MPFRDLVVSLLSASLGPARPYTDFLAWERPAGEREQLGRTTRSGAQKSGGRRVGNGKAAGPRQSRKAERRPRPIQVWLSFAPGRGENTGPPESCVLWLVDPDLEAPIRHTISDLPDLHTFLGLVHGAADGGPDKLAPPAAAPRTPAAPSAGIPAVLRRALLRLRGQGNIAAPTTCPRNDPPPGTIRARAFHRLAELLGDYSEIPIRGGSLYRWIIARANGSKVYISLDSPELPDVAHISISDPSRDSPKPLEAHTAATDEEIERVIEHIGSLTAAPA